MVGEFRFHWLLMLSGKSTRSTEINVSIDIIILTRACTGFSDLKEHVHVNHVVGSVHCSMASFARFLQPRSHFVTTEKES